MERKIGETFDYNGVRLKVVNAEDNYCTGCYFSKKSSCGYSIRDMIGPCGKHKRSDSENIIFKRIKTRKTIRETNAEY